jgi:hypothetical protein
MGKMAGPRRWFQELLYKSGLLGKKPEAGEDRTGAETVHVPRIESIHGVGKLEYDQEYDGWRSQPVKVNVLDGKLLPFILADEWNQVSLLQPIQSAVENFLGLDPEHREELTDLVYKNYEEVLERSTFQPLPIREKSQIWKYIFPTEILIKQGVDDATDIFIEHGVVYIVASGYCEWEQEHGLEMVFKRGNEVVRVSEIDTSW